ncbi:MAG TPA: hypothetical protein VE093_10140 [Polyangiaceae bacterium]|nr:hypothetical protein [Polyangiaceae bacterium]
MTRNQKSASVLRISAIVAALALATLTPGCTSRSQETAPSGPSIAPEGQPRSESTLGAQPSPPSAANPTSANQPQPTPGSAAQPTPTSAAQPTTTAGAPTPSPTSSAGMTAPPSGGCDPGKEPNRAYTMRDPNQCKVALFQCPAGKKAFFNNCGCGCE